MNSEGLGFGLGWDFRLICFLITVQESTEEEESLGEAHRLKGGRRKGGRAVAMARFWFIDHDPAVKPWRTGRG